MALRLTLLKIVSSRIITSSNKYTQSVRYGSYKSSQMLEDIGEPTTKYVVSEDPEEWKYVERALPLTLIPEPIVKETYPSGWKPQIKDVTNRPYFVERTKNHMVPVYLNITQRGVRRHTVIKNIQGDINLLEKELSNFLQKDSFKPIRSHVNEFSGLIRINGDFVNATKYFLEKKNL